MRALFEGLVRFYYPWRTLRGGEHLPRKTCAILVANHPNGLIDPLLIRVSTGVPARFLAKSTLFKNPLARFTLNAFGALPVYRKQDAGEGEHMRDGNEATFALAREVLAQQHVLALFPEGVSHADPERKPLRTGAARIALSAIAAHDACESMVIVPVGVEYAQREIFRSAVCVRVGVPIDVRPLRELYAQDSVQAVETLTSQIADGLDTLIAQAPSYALLETMTRLADWTLLDEHVVELAQRDQRRTAILNAYRRLKLEDPVRLDALTDEVLAYDAALRAHGIEDPWALTLQSVSVRAAILGSLWLILFAPLALVGAALSWVPYRLVGVVAARVTPHRDVLGTVKLLGGMLFLSLAWLLESLLAAWRLGALYALAVLVLAPLSGYVALRWDERLRSARVAMGYAWFRAAHSDKQRKLDARRRALVHTVLEGLSEYEHERSRETN